MPEQFDISAHVVIQLGEQLITDGLTALLELAKNSYDAGSKYVKITINTKDQVDTEIGHNFGEGVGYVVIEDRGCGMTRNDVIDSWLRFSYSKKRILKQEGGVKDSDRYPLGDKGLGRLSTQKIGNNLELVTVRNGEKTRLLIKWGDFQEDRKLSDVPVRINTDLRCEEPNGTKLIISDLNDSSELVNIPTLESKLIQLFSPRDPKQFTVFTTVNGTQLDLVQRIEQLRNLANYSFEFSFKNLQNRSILKISGKARLGAFVSKSSSKDTKANFEQFIRKDRGHEFFQFLTDKEQSKGNFLKDIEYRGGNPWFISIEKDIVLFENNTNNLLQSEEETGPFSGFIEAYALSDDDADPEASDSTIRPDALTTLGDYKPFLKSQLGIRVYRDGFAIRPFGFEGDDWLQLGGLKTGGDSYYTLRPGNSIGAIRLTGRENKNLQETTAREGLVRNLCFKRFSDILDRLISEINVQFIGKIRRSLNDFYRYKRNENLDKEKPLRQEERLDAPIKAIEAQNLAKELRETSTKDAEDKKHLESKGELFLSFEEKAEIKKLGKEIEVKNATAKLLDSVGAILPKATAEIEALRSREVAMQDEMQILFELASLGMVAEVLSHEISNVASNLAHRSKALLDKLRRSPDLNPDLLNFAEFVYSSTSALRKQVSHLSPSLRYVREEKSKIELPKFLTQLVDFHNDRLAGKNVTVKLTTNPPVANVSINRGRLTQVMDNLINNSEYWLKQQSKSSLNSQPTVSIDVTGYIVTLWDNGIGIATHLEDTLFHAFVTAKPKGAGRGLGLYICDKLLESVGGSIRLTGERNDRGNRYKFEIDLSYVK